MGLTYILILLLSAASFFRRPQRGEAPKSAPDLARTTVVVAALCVLTCGLYASERYILEYMGAHQNPQPVPAWFADLPLAYVLQFPPYHIAWNPSLLTLLDAIAILQCAVLAGFYFALRHIPGLPPGLCVIVFAGAVVLSAIGLRAQTMSGDDLYLYIGLALAGPSAYHPDAVPLSGIDAAVSQMWGVPIHPSPYGPLWIALSKLAISGAHSLLAQLMALRWVQILALVTCAGALVSLKRTLLLPALLILNPVVYDFYVVDGHNDLTGVAFVLAAAACRKRLWLAVPLAAAAGLIKLPFIVGAMLAFAAEPTLMRRAIPAAGSAALALVLSFVLVGPDYEWALRQGYLIYGGAIPIEMRVLQILVVAVALFAVAFALTLRRYFAGASWSFLAFGHFAFPWYLAWGAPYAILSEPPVLVFFVTWPIAKAMLTSYVPPSPIVAGLRYGLIVVFAVVLAILLRKSRPPLQAALER
jgi:hypothetical protein